MYKCSAVTAKGHYYPLKVQVFKEFFLNNIYHECTMACVLMTLKFFLSSGL